MYLPHRICNFIFRAELVFYYLSHSIRISLFVFRTRFVFYTQFVHSVSLILPVLLLTGLRHISHNVHLAILFGYHIVHRRRSDELVARRFLRPSVCDELHSA